MYQILKRQQYGRCTKNKSHYYPNKLYYNETVNLKQRYEHPITTIQFDGVKSREQRLASVTLHDGLITISKPSPSSTSSTLSLHPASSPPSTPERFSASSDIYKI